MMRCATVARLASELLILAAVFCHIIYCQSEVPTPVITLHKGHIGLYDRLLETQFNEAIQMGEAYTLDIYMGNTEEYDYAIENCVFNSRLSFMDNYGCLRKNAFFVEKWETDQYNRPGAVKRTLVHFLAEQPILQFECQLKVIHCSGCAEQSCERRPVYHSYPTWNMPLSCCNNYPPPPVYPVIPPMPPPPPPMPISPYDDNWWFDSWFRGIPWYLWLLFLLLLLLLLCCCLGLLACCFARNRRKRRSSRNTRSYTPPTPLPHSSRVYTVDGAVQTLPELKQASQQVNMPQSYSRVNHLSPSQQKHAYNLRQVDNHATIDLHPETSTSRQTASAAYTNRVYDGDYYEEDMHEKVYTRYDNYNSPKQESNTSVAHSIPIHHQRSPSSHNAQEERRLQHELEEHLRQRPHYQDRSDEFVERIEEQLRNQYHSQKQRPTNPESFREETVRSVRQSSVI